MKLKQRTKALWIAASAAFAIAAIVIPLLVFAGSEQTTFTATLYSDAIRFEADGVASLRVTIYDLSENELWNSALVMGDFVDWDRANKRGERLANGYYMYLAQGWDTGNRLILSKAGKIVLLPGDQVELKSAPAADTPARNSEGGSWGEDPIRVGTMAVSTLATLGNGKVIARDAGTADVGFELEQGSFEWIFRTYDSSGGFTASKSGTGGTEVQFNTSGGDFRNAYIQIGDGNARIANSGDSYFAGGNVGIGTTSPAVVLDVEGTQNASPGSDGIVNIGESSGPHLTLDDNGIYAKSGASGDAPMFINHDGGDVTIAASASGNVGLATSASATYAVNVGGDINIAGTGQKLFVDGNEALWYDGTYFSWGFGSVHNYFARDVGIGDSSPESRLHVADTISATTIAPATHVATIENLSTTTNADVLCLKINTTSNPQDTNNFISFVKADNNCMGSIEGDGAGNLRFDSTGCDFAEMLAAGDGLEPGDVLAIGPDGVLVRSGEAYQTNVAGVHSTAPGFLAGWSGADNVTPEEMGVVPLAFVGVVPTKVCAVNGAIQPGDLLVASSIPGHAMKGDLNPPTGSVVGKAMEALEEGIGLIRMLIVLQ